MLSRNPTINLFKRSVQQETTLIRVANWALQAGRWIVILTELVVIGAFLYRFNLDRRIKILEESINSEKILIESFQTMETQFRTVQSNLAILDTVMKQQTDLDPFFKEFSRSVPQDLIVYTYSIGDDNTLMIRGVALAEESISNFVTNLRTSYLFTDVDLIQASLITEDKDKGKLAFTIKGTLSDQSSPTKQSPTISQ